MKNPPGETKTLIFIGLVNLEDDDVLVLPQIFAQKKKSVSPHCWVYQSIFQ